jgi:hypothetical protein
VNASHQWRSRELRTNCLLWAIRQWRRRGGYLTLRRADLALSFPHVGWMPRHGRYIYHYRPLDRSVRWPWPWISGYIQRHED